jgi:hypothetical protein
LIESPHILGSKPVVCLINSTSAKLGYKTCIINKSAFHPEVAMRRLRNRPFLGLFYLEKVIAKNEYDYRNFMPAYFLKHRKRS